MDIKRNDQELDEMKKETDIADIHQKVQDKT